MTKIFLISLKSGASQYKIVVEDEKGCSNRYEEKIRIYELPTISFISDTQYA